MNEYFSENGSFGSLQKLFSSYHGAIYKALYKDSHRLIFNKHKLEDSFCKFQLEIFINESATCSCAICKPPIPLKRSKVPSLTE